MIPECVKSAPLTYSRSQNIGGAIVVGIGNPLLSDDTVGLKVVNSLEKEYQDEFPTVTFVQLNNVGLELLDDLDGRAHALFVDCIRTGTAKPGHCHEFGMADLRETIQSRLVDSHGMNLATIIALGERMGYSMPREILILGVEGKFMHDFSEEPTAEVCAGIAECVKHACRILRSWKRIPFAGKSGFFLR
jgi:hydrogenase maturation protease